MTENGSRWDNPPEGHRTREDNTIHAAELDGMIRVMLAEPDAARALGGAGVCFDCLTAVCQVLHADIERENPPQITRDEDDPDRAWLEVVDAGSSTGLIMFAIGVNIGRMREAETRMP